MQNDNPPQKSQPRFRLSWSFVLTIALALVLLYLAFRGVDWGEMLRTVQQGRLEFLFLGFLAMSASYFLRGLRWRVLLSAEKTLHPVTVFWGTCVGYLGNAFLPARAGELIRTALISQRSGIAALYVLATALTERIMDAALLVLIVVFMLSTFEGMPEWLISAQQVMLIIGVGGMIGLLLAYRLKGLILAVVTRLPLPERIEAKLLEFIEQFLLGTRAFQNPGRAVSFIALTAVIWAMDVVVGLQIAQAFGLEISAAEVLFLLAALGLSSAIPSTPGYVGVYQFVAVTVLEPFGIGQSEALVYILAFQAVTYAVVMIWGGLGLWRLNVGIGERANDPAAVSVSET